MRVRIIKDDERLGVVSGETYSAKRYKYDPEKITLIAREDDDYDPECNQYMSDVHYWMKNQWMTIQGGQYVAVEAR